VVLKNFSSVVKCLIVVGKVRQRCFNQGMIRPSDVTHCLKSGAKICFSSVVQIGRNFVLSVV
jgi:hypothetical protein